MQSGFTFHLKSSMLFYRSVSCASITNWHQLLYIRIKVQFFFHRLKLSKYTNKASLIEPSEKGDFLFTMNEKTVQSMLKHEKEKMFQQYNVKRYLIFQTRLIFRMWNFKASVENSLRIEARNLICFSSILNATFYSYTKSVIVANQMPLICK